MEKMVSYSQEYEDIILYNILKDVDNLFWIDIGANDPVYLSVTKFFSLRGAHGINIEPQKQCIKRLKKDRPKDINLAVGVSNKAGIIKMRGRGTGASFDVNLPTVSEWGATYEVPVMTLTDICNEYVGKEEIHFLKIDVEGWEKECLEGADFIAYRPWVLCIEAEEPGSNKPRWKEWENILFDSNYHLMGVSLPNRYYVSEEHIDLMGRFVDCKNICKLYDISKFEYDEKTKKKMRDADRIQFALEHPLTSLKVIVKKLIK